MPKVLFVGHGRAGKDHSCIYFSNITGLKNAGTCSIYLAKFVAEELGQPVEQAYTERHDEGKREIWKRVGDDIRKNDPSKIVREMLNHGDVGGGLRGLSEIIATKRQKLADLIVWVHRDVPLDPTLEFGYDHCDIVIDNNGSLEQLEEKLRALAKFAGLLKEKK